MSNHELITIKLTKAELILLAASSIRAHGDPAALKPEYSTMHTKIANALSRI